MSCIPVPSPAETSQLTALYNTGRFVELESRARALTGQCPDFGFGWQLLGGALHMQGKDALPAFRKAAQLMPNEADAHFNLGNVLKGLGQLDEAVTSYRRALELKPDSFEIHGSLGDALEEIGQHEAAQTSRRRAAQLKHNLAEAHNKHGVALLESGQFDGAVANFRSALQHKPDYARAYNNLGLALFKCGKFDDALDSYRRALQLNPDSAAVHSNLGSALRDLGHADDAVHICRRALEINPTYVEAHVNLGNALQDQGKLDDAAASYRRALQIKPDCVDARSNLLFCLSNSEEVGVQTLFVEHCRFGEHFEASLRATWPRHTNSKVPERILQVGIVSGDFRNHAIAYFFELVLAHLSLYSQLSLHGYYNHDSEDSVTHRLRNYLTHWHPIANLADDVLAQKIREDGIDILIDLSGHTAKNRLLTFARKPAPIQASWMGYPGTTGLTAIDYYLADRFLLPPGQFDGQFTEKLVYLPANAPFLPFKSAAPLNALPALNNGHMTFGSFNRSSKISRSVIILWSQLLRALPNSRMLLGGMPEKEVYASLIDWFGQEGIARERLDFHARSSMERYLELHQQVDVCLDTFPYNGGTTTLHALWMGVPTLTLAGHKVAGRQGASLLGHVGLESFIAHDAADFVQKGVSWAGDLAALSAIRTGMRERFAKSAMGQPSAVAAGLERALRVMWRRWCEGLPPVIIDESDYQINHDSSPLNG